MQSASSAGRVVQRPHADARALNRRGGDSLAWDQPDNARRLEKLGVGMRLGSRRRTGAHLARALSGLLTAKTKAACRAAAIQLGDEDGLETAAAWIKEFATNPRARSAVGE